MCTLRYILHYLKLIKANEYEPAFMSEVAGTRKREHKAIKTDQIIRGLAVASNNVLTVAATMTTIIAMLKCGHSITASTVVPLLALNRQIRYQLNLVPISATALNDARVSLQRLKELFKLKSDSNNQPIVTVTFNDFSLKWNAYQWTIPKGGIVNIVGSSGGGKSMFLKQITSDLMQEQVAYCGKTPWLLRQSIRENILLNTALDDARFSDILSRCALDVDLGSYLDCRKVSDDAENLSGGQRQRICLARTVYSPANVWLIDDILTSLDERTYRYVFEKCFLEKPKAVTIFYAGQLPWSDFVINLDDGSISQRQHYDYSRSVYTGIDHIKPSLTERSSEPEDRTSLNCLKLWLKEAGGSTFLAGAFSCLILSSLGRTLFETMIASNWTLEMSVSGFMAYLACCMVQILLPFLYTWIVTNRGLVVASKYCLASVRTHLFTPYNEERKSNAELTNIYSKDQDSVDISLHVYAGAFGTVLVSLLFTCKAMVFARPWLIFAFLFVFLIYYRLGMKLRRRLRQMRVQEVQSRTPILQHLHDFIGGSAVIRGLHQNDYFFNCYRNCCDKHVYYRILFLVTRVWFTLWIKLIGSIMTFAVGLVCCATGVPAGVTGLLIYYSNSLPGAFLRTWRQFAQFEAHLISFSRLSAICQFKYAGKYEVPDSNVPDRPPSLMVKNITCNDRFDNISFKVESENRLLIQGRTGSGKSSLLLAIMGMIPISSGIITFSSNFKHSFSYSPQETQIFHGKSVRFNLDPTGTVPDTDLWNVLRDLGSELGLDDTVETGSPTTSQELICLARALARPSKMILLDEPLASMEKQGLLEIIQREALLKLLEERTIIIVSHRDEFRSLCNEILYL